MFIQTILHCCSQLALQLYIIADDEENSNYITMTIICAIINFIAILWSLFVYTLYGMFKDRPIRLISKLVIFTWHLSIIISRILALAFFTVAFHAFVFIPFGIHWAIWSIVLLFITTEFCVDMSVTPNRQRPYLELPYNVLVGYMLLFFYYNGKKGRTWCVVLPYHIVTFLETAVLSVMFYVEKPNEWYSLLILCLSILLFLIGCTLILLYYTMLHPKTSKYLPTWNRRIHHTNGNTTTERQSSHDC